MSNSEFKARALYDFVAEGSNELSFNANDILTITSNTAGHGWWYAKNSSGRVGVIPENYVQALADPPEPNEPPPPLSTFSNTNNIFPSLDGFGSNNNASRTSNPPPYDQHQYMNPASYNNWQPQESSAWPSLSSSPQPNQLNKQKLANSIQPLKLPTETEKASTNAISTPPSPYDGYITVKEVSPRTSVIQTAHSDSSLERNSPSDQSDGWYSNLPNTPAPISSKTNEPSSDQTFKYDVSKISSPPEQDHYLDPIPFQQQTSIYASIGGVPSTLALSEDLQTPSTFSMPIEASSSTSSLSSTATKLTATTSMPTASSTSPKKKKMKTLKKLLTLSRKPKSQKEKHNSDPEISRQATKKDTDSDDSFSDSEYPSRPSQATNSNPQSKQHSVIRTNTLPVNPTLNTNTRASLTSAEVTKGPPRARFFDKHGLDNYLLNGYKGKTDEHVEIAFDEREGGVYWSSNPGIPPFSCKLEEPSKGTKLGGLKAFMEYKIHPQISGSRPVGRRYKQFDWLHEQLVNKFRFVCIPPLPGKQIAGRFEQDFIEERRRQLELWLNRICRHPVLCASFPVQHFITCELSEKNKKDWKSGKRRIEKDELREASWLQCVTLTSTGLSEQQIASQIETFFQQQPGLESQLKNLSQGLTKYIERHTEVYERDIQRVSELFTKVHQAVHLDTTTPGNKELAGSIHTISKSYNEIAVLYKTKGSEGLRDFNERIQEYIGLLACFPSILSLQKSASEFMKTSQQRAQVDFTNTIHRNHVLNHVVLAEINFFQKEKVNDLNIYLKTLVDEQIEFYKQIVADLTVSSETFK